MSSVQGRDETVGFVGLGAMGGPMATNILKRGFPLVVFDIDASKNERFAERGAHVASGPVDVARQARIVISMVDTTAQAEEVIVGKDGFIVGGQAGDVVISMSTIDPRVVRSMHAQLTARGIALVDAPVSGMIAGAEKGTLKAYVGGEAAALEKCRHILEAMTSEIRHIGATGQGVMMKLVNNMLAQAGRVLVVEAMVMGAKAGLDPEMMIEII